MGLKQVLYLKVCHMSHFQKLVPHLLMICIVIMKLIVGSWQLIVGSWSFAVNKLTLDIAYVDPTNQVCPKKYFPIFSSCCQLSLDQ